MFVCCVPATSHSSITHKSPLCIHVGVSVTDDDFSGGGEKPVEATCLLNPTTDAGQEYSDMEMTVTNDSYTSEPADKLRPSKPVEGSFQEFWKELQNAPMSPDASTTAIADPHATHDSRLTCIDPPPPPVSHFNGCSFRTAPETRRCVV